MEQTKRERIPLSSMVSERTYEMYAVRNMNVISNVEEIISLLIRCINYVRKN